MQGDVWAESKPGAGSTFHCTVWMKKSKTKKSKKNIPSSASVKKTLTIENSISKATGKHKTDSSGKTHPQARHSVKENMKHSSDILLAEDNLVNQKLWTMMLTKKGHNVEIANNGKEVVEMFTSSPDSFDLIFMDIHMPEMDGIAATRKIRSLGFSSIPIIALTASTLKEDMQACLEAGMNDYLTKPIKREIVFETLEKMYYDRGNHNQ